MPWTNRLTAKAFALALSAALSISFIKPGQEPYQLHEFRKVQLSTEFYAEGANVGDFNNDDVVDVASGPYWYEGPEFETRHEIFTPRAFADDLNIPIGLHPVPGGASDTVRIAAAAALEQIDPAVAVSSLVPLLAEETGPIALRRAAALVPSIFGETLSEEELHDLVRYRLTRT